MIVNHAGPVEYTPLVRMLCVGQSNLNKMKFANTFPDVLWVSANADKTTLATLGVPYVEVSTLQDATDVKVALDRDDTSREELFGFPIQTLVIDSIDELQRLLFVERLKDEHRSDIIIDDWNWIANRLHALFSGYAGLELNLVILAGANEVQTGETEFLTKPNIQGGFVNGVHKYVNYSVLLQSGAILNPVEAPVSDVTEENGEVSIETENSLESLSWLVTRPLPKAAWIQDGSGTLPFTFDLNFENDYERIAELRATKIEDLQYVDPVEINPLPIEEAEEVSVTTETIAAKDIPHNSNDSLAPCKKCGKEVESLTWLQLAEMKGLPPLCKDHYKEAVKTKK